MSLEHSTTRYIKCMTLPVAIKVRHKTKCATGIHMHLLSFKTLGFLKVLKPSISDAFALKMKERTFLLRVASLAPEKAPNISPCGNLSYVHISVCKWFIAECLFTQKQPEILVLFYPQQSRQFVRTKKKRGGRIESNCSSAVPFFFLFPYVPFILGEFWV